MVHRTIDVTYIGYEDGIKQDMSLQSIENGISILKPYNFETSTLPFCTIEEMFEQFELNIIPTESGYSQSYSTYATNNVLPNSQGSLEITFINNNKLVGKGNRKYTYTNGSRHEFTTIHAVKISDNINLNTSTDLTYSSSIEAVYDTLLDMDAICIALSDLKAITYENGKKTIENNVQYAQSFGLGENDIIGIQTFKTRAVHREEELQRIGGVLLNDSHLISWANNKQCSIDDSDCLDKGTLDFNVIKNDHSGIAFSTHFNTYGEGFLNVDISLIINSVINEE